MGHSVHATDNSPSVQAIFGAGRVHPSFIWARLSGYLGLLAFGCAGETPAGAGAKPACTPSERKTVKLQRSGYVAGIALTAALSLAACGSDNNDVDRGRGERFRGGRQLRHAAASPRRARRPRRTPWPSGSRTTRASARVRRSTTSGTGSGAGVQAFTAGTADFAGSDSALKPEEHAKADPKCPGGVAMDLPMVVGPIAVVYNVDGVEGPAARRPDPGQDLRRQDHQVERPGDRGAELRRDAAVHRDPDGAPLGLVRHHRQLHQVPDAASRRPTGPSTTTRPGRPRAASAPRVRTAWPPRSRAPRARSPTSSSRSPRTAASRWRRSRTAPVSTPS